MEYIELLKDHTFIAAVLVTFIIYFIRYIFVSWANGYRYELYQKWKEEGYAGSKGYGLMKLAGKDQDARLFLIEFRKESGLLPLNETETRS